MSSWCWDKINYGCQLVLQSVTKYFSQGSIIADSREAATGLMVITSGQVGVELPMDSDEADEEHRTPGGKTQLYVFSRGSAAHHNFLHYVKS